MPPLGLYVHLPWCLRKCPYCDFNSHELKTDLPAEDYCAALIADLEEDLPLAWGRTVTSVFIGGGTPSLFSGPIIEQLLSQLRALIPLAPGAEITLEVNPGTIERDSFEAYAEAGINRVSLGVQSFDDALLKAIGRIHGSEEVNASLKALHQSPISNFNIDLMFGLPDQSLRQAQRDVSWAIESGATHVSHYQLTLEPNTLFAARPPALPEADACWEMQESCAGLLETAGFEQYEVSAWAQPGAVCAHNLNYWKFGDYLGIGAGAHSKLTLPSQSTIVRQVKVRHPTRYLAGKRMAQQKNIEPADRIFEFFLNALRLRDGISRQEFEQRTALSWLEVADVLESSCADGLLESVGGGVRPTALGWRFVNDLQARFLPEAQGNKA